MRLGDPNRIEESERLRYRAATVADAPRLAELWKELSVDQLSKDRHYDADPRLAISVDDASYEDLVGNPDCGIFVAESPERIVAFVEVWFRRRDENFFIDDYGYIQHLFVEPDSRFRDLFDICNTLYWRAESWAADRGCSTVQADVFYHNAHFARMLTDRVGFASYRTRYVKSLRKEHHENTSGENRAVDEGLLHA